MVLLISQNNDASTNVIIDWLYRFGLSFVRLTPFSFAEINNITFSNKRNHNKIKLRDGCVIDLCSFDYLFYRNGFFSSNSNHFINELNKNEYLQNFVESAKEEARYLKDFLISSLSDLPSLSQPNNVEANKLYNLRLAAKHKLLIPDTLVTTNKAELIKFKKEHGEVIIKSMTEKPFVLNVNEKRYVGYTKIVKNDFVKNMNENFFPSLFQKYIKPVFEVRVFFLGSKLYSTAIFPKKNNLDVDHRNFKDSNPNTYVPYKLPETYQKKLLGYLTELRLETGSVDLICDSNDDLYLLEINPTGQYIGSLRCNYNIEMEIVKYIKTKLENG